MSTSFSEFEQSKVQYFDKLKEEYEDSSIYTDEIPEVTLKYPIKPKKDSSVGEIVYDASIYEDYSKSKFTDEQVEFIKSCIYEEPNIEHVAEYPIHAVEEQ